MSQGHWRKCSTCKKEIGFQKVYQACSISSCRKWVFCSVDCWDVHNSVMGHKSAWAEERVSPRRSEVETGDGPKRRIVTSKSANGQSSYSTNDNIPKDILIVASKLKAYVKAKHDLNTSANVMEKLSDIVRRVCDDAVENARTEGRKTLMDRDFR